MSNKLKKNDFPFKIARLGAPKQLYFCDPLLNITCPGRFQDNHCGTICFCTIYKDFSKYPHKPITAKQYYKEKERRNKEK